MKKHIPLIVVSIALIAANGLAVGQHRQPPQPKMPHPGDTVFPGSTEWLHAGSPRNSVTGEDVVLIWGNDGQLHPLGYAVRDADGSWVDNTPENRTMIEDHAELVRLKAAVKQIMLESPDRKIIRPAKALSVSVTYRDTGYDPYKDVMHWADSIGKRYDDPDFLQEMEQYYRLPNNGLWQTPYSEALRD